MVDRRLKTHDANQLQLKIGYTVEPGVKRQRYLVESYMFVPRTLGVGGHSYRGEQFYEDTQTFVRLMTPSVALEALAKAGRAERYFDPVRAGLDDLLGGTTASVDRLMRGLKVLGCIYQSAIRDEGRLLLERFDALDGSDAAATRMREDELARGLDSFRDYLEQALLRLRTCGERCEHAVVPEDVRVTWGVVDEFAALYAEETVTSIVSACDRRRPADGSALAAARKRLADFCVAQYHYRRTRGYPSYLVPGASNEAVPWRRRILKRIIHSALFLDTRHEEGGAVQRDVIAGIAAAFAMLFAVLVAAWAQIAWGALSTGFIIAAVVSYIVKDRIKEWGRRYLGRRFARFVPDFAVRVRDLGTGKAIGLSRESVRVIDPGHIDPEILALRHADHPSVVAQNGRAEVVIRFVKEVTLDSDKLHSALDGVEGLNDIIRFNFSRFRQRMDKPIEIYRVVHPDTGEIVAVPCNRVYHINLVLRFTQGDGAKRAVRSERVRVIVDQKGLKRVESVDVMQGGTLDRVTGAVFGKASATNVISVIDEDGTERAVPAPL
ncbi:MAG: hypothetical protein KC635_19950 [Myxococcales bacterium]|nr:hypothetical protein [Myxococcales bacterium]MCB9733274.1 hypothetical protein [Deltaproteobacteria bacterium]